MSKEPTPVTRKSVSLPDDLWEEILEYRHKERIGTEAEALRRLLQSGLRAETKKKGSK
jgi:metal-responsive CopG/Arc/MetJ family transcriptional regulator